MEISRASRGRVHNIFCRLARPNEVHTGQKVKMKRTNGGSEKNGMTMLRSRPERLYLWATLYLLILDVSTGRLNAFSKHRSVGIPRRHLNIPPTGVRQRHLKEDNKKNVPKKDEEKKGDKKEVGKKNEEKTDAPSMSPTYTPTLTPTAAPVEAERPTDTTSPTSILKQTPTAAPTEEAWPTTSPSTSVILPAVSLRAFDILLSCGNLSSGVNPLMGGENVGVALQNYLQSHFILDAPIKNVTLSLISSSSTINSSGDVNAWFRFDGSVLLKSVRQLEAEIELIVWTEQRLILFDQRALQRAFTSTFAEHDIVVRQVVFDVEPEELNGAEYSGEGFNAENKTDLPHNVIYIGASLIVVITIAGVAAILYSRYTVISKKRASHEEACNDPPKLSNRSDQCTDGVPEEVVLSENSDSAEISVDSDISTSSSEVVPAGPGGKSEELFLDCRDLTKLKRQKFDHR